MVVSTAETLTAEARATITAAFGAPVIDNFGSSEGLVGHTTPDDATFTFNSDVCVVELVDREGRPTPEGVAADRVLVTNLASGVQPLIRYELGDRFVRASAAPDHGFLRARVEGRADEILRFGTVDVHPHVIRAVLVATPEIADYQVHQTADGVALHVIPAASLELDRLRRRVAEALGRAGLPSPIVTTELVDRLPRDAQTGKLRRFVPLTGSGR
jgi:phenylacetate-coenzyme A ligase PaaK-like adenylate-forming protein